MGAAGGSMKHANAASKFLRCACDNGDHVLANRNWIRWLVHNSWKTAHPTTSDSQPSHFSFLFVTGTRKFAQAYMLARELGSGAFSVVKLGVNLVSQTFQLRVKRSSNIGTFFSPPILLLPSRCVGNGPEDSSESGVEEEAF